MDDICFLSGIFFFLPGGSLELVRTREKVELEKANENLLTQSCDLQLDHHCD